MLIDARRKLYGREDQLAKLESALWEVQEGFHVVGVSGPGGVGKTFLTEHVLRTTTVIKDLNYLVIRVAAPDDPLRFRFED